VDSATAGAGKMMLKNRPAQDLYPCRLLVSSLKYINSMIAIVDKTNSETDKILRYSRETDEVVGQTAENFKTYMRDTGQILNDLSMPIYIDGKHWGAMIIGFDPKVMFAA
jgi:hypothetical protein